MRAALIALLFAACGGSSAPAPHDPADRPPLPPASGTPIGYLIDAGELKLSDDQVAKLKVIDDDLATKLAHIDGVQRAASEPEVKDDSRGRAEFGVSTESNGMSDGVAATPTPVDRTTANSGTGGGSSSEDRAATLKRVPEARAYAVRTAISRALALLDAGQQKLARRLLQDRGVDPDTGHFEATGEPGAARGSGN